MTLANLAALFIVAGLALLAAVARIAWLSRRQRRIVEALLALDCAEPLAWPHEAWPWLRQAGVKNLRWRGEWQGAPLSGELGEALGAPPWQSGFELGDDLRIEIEAGLGRARGETRWLAQAALELFLLLWRQRALEACARVEAALRAHGRKSAALLHQMRNFAQWVLWNAEGFAAAQDDGQLLQRARAWQALAPQVAARAQAMLRASAATPPADAPAGALAPLARACAQLAGCAIDIHGEARSSLPRALWQDILDNLLINLRQSAPEGARLDLAASPGAVQMTLTLPRPTFALPVERLFVPFMSGRADGLGLGLYLARRAARAVGGELTAQESPARLILHLPEPQAPALSKNQTLPPPARRHTV